MSTTPLGWPVGTDTTPVVVGRAGIVLYVKPGDPAVVMRWLANRWDRYVEPLLPGQCGAYNLRKNVNARSVWSEHAAGTAMDLNWRLHPNGTPASDSLRERVEKALFREVTDGLVRWGGDYRHTKDPMHLELIRDLEGLHLLAEHLQGRGPRPVRRKV